MKRSDITRRGALLAGAASAPAWLLAGRAPAYAQNRQPFAGTTLNISCWSAPYARFVADYLPEFTAATGIRVNYDTPGFAIYNQRADLELSTRGSAYDVLNVTFIYTSRWIGAGWLTPLDEFIDDRAKTPAEWDFSDFLPGTVHPMKDRAGKIYGVPWVADILMSGTGRMDLLRQAGLGMPDTFEELERSMALVHNKEEVPAYITENHYGWTFIPFLQGFGGNVFRNPPDDLFPTLDSPEAIAAAEFLAKLLRGGFTAVAKKEAASIPGFGAAFRLADVAFVDRSDTTAARAALEPAVQRLRDGISLVIAPEGTRSATPALATPPLRHFATLPPCHSATLPLCHFSFGYLTI